MSLQGPLVVVAEQPAPDLVEALAAAGAFPVVESRWTDAPAAFVSIQPAAVVLAEPGPPADAEAAHTLVLQVRTRSGPIVPVIARSRRDAPVAIADPLVIDGGDSVARIVARLRGALRVRAQHAAVLRRAETLAAQTGRVADLPGSDPLDDATVLVTGRGGSYPSLAVAVGERVGLVGALSIETAMRYLDAREIDGIVIGEGFSAQMVAGLLTVLAADARFRDLPLALTCGKVQVVPFQHALANLERIEEGPARLLEWLLPLVRLRAFESRLKRVLRAFDAQGMLDAESGLMTEAAFWPELARAVSEAQRRGSGLCIARFVFDSRLDRRTSLDAARLISRIVRNIDFGHRQADGAVLVVFTETELRAAHLVARRIAGSLRRTMRVSERDPRRSEPAVTLATLKASDTLDTLIARIGARAVAVA